MLMSVTIKYELLFKDVNSTKTWIPIISVEIRAITKTLLCMDYSEIFVTIVIVSSRFVYVYV